MTSRRAFRIVRTAVVLAIFLASSSMSQPDGPFLVRIDRQQRAPIDDAWMAGIKVLQELRTCTIAELPGELLSRLRARGIALEVLDRDPAGKPYYLVYVPGAEGGDALEAFGQARPVEGGLFLFWTGSKDVRDVLPADYALKRLPPATDLPLQIEVESEDRSTAGAAEDSPAAIPDPGIQQMVAGISNDGLATSIRDLQDFGTRYAPTAGCEAAGDYIRRRFDSLSLESTEDSFYFGSGYSSRNIIGTLPGRTSPDRTVIVCAHYDSTSSQAATRAPGADDNASGTAAVLELARVMRDYSFDFTIKYVAFSAEEGGLWGSKHFAQQAKQNGEKIIAVVNLDMIGYADIMPEDLEVIADPRSEWLADRFIASARAYTTLDLAKRIDASLIFSDHSPFWDRGYSALLGIEDRPLTNPHYHKPTDTADTLNLDFLVEAAQAALAAVADLAQPRSIPAAPSGLGAHSRIHRLLFARFKTAYLSWTPSTDPVTGYRVYRSLTPHAGYRLAAELPAGETSFVDRFLDGNRFYYYVVTAGDAQGRESTPSGEVRDDESIKIK